MVPQHPGAAWCSILNLQERRRAERARRAGAHGRALCDRKRPNRKSRENKTLRENWDCLTTAWVDMLEPNKDGEIERAWLIHDPARAEIPADVWRKLRSFKRELR